MKEQIEQIGEFAEAFGIKEAPFPSELNLEEGILRFSLMEEENEEYLQAVNANDLVGIADSLVDMAYVLLGTIRKHGLEELFIPMFNEVHRSNMSKLDENGKPIINGEGIYDAQKPLGKVLKSHLYVKPNLEQFFDED
jgi:predicted HAD superfamily Cof-like phosphohydrolase